MWKRSVFRHANIQQRPDIFWLATASLSRSIVKAKFAGDMRFSTSTSSADARMPFLVTAFWATCWVFAFAKDSDIFLICSFESFI